MFDSHEFYKKRFSSHLKETGRYLKYIFNGHMAFAILFFISASAYYYQQWLTELPANFPTALIIGITFGLIVSYSPVRTLLKEPDLVFLIVAETKMGAYFRNALIYSFVIQLYMILLFAAAFGPLYFASYPERAGSMYLLTLVLLLLFKVANLFANWWMLKVREPGIRNIDLLIRTVLNGVIFYFIVNGDMLFAGITSILFVIVFLYDYYYSNKQSGLAWDLLVEKDQNRMQTFYRIANMFADVPHLKNRVKKRQWLVHLVNRGVPIEKKHTYDYLFRISFIRSGDYLGMYVRLIVIGGLFIYFIPNVWMKILFGILFLYLSTFQMMPLYQHHRTNMWLDLYPVELNYRRSAVLKIVYQLSTIQTLLFALLFVLLQEYLGFVIVLGGGLLFTVLFVNGYMKPRLK
ncbi:MULTISPECIES: ABC transporter permease [Oceanobacillus]|uniref:ABC transporter permease n=1 Tax=Oceanobacillus profundus TaxID=372463 RepID=A0A417YLY7_9BACI|nr:ABC transporter permease [Oceanobacillus profundus]MBR3119150.1 ABC transporter permease [Oceanobacillus sp.]MCM3400486.1 ABC transporter permease [Oceanobacillus profundus]PAE29476.1 ABC transporter permease [Paenibacillus sp. 7884-2]RHW34382.1 ABC transporter permease [Oceanobacillus profundus]